VIPVEAWVALLIFVCLAAMLLMLFKWIG